MTIKFLASLAVAATLFTACGESSTTPPSKAEQCAVGLTNDCVMGTWSIDGPTVPRSAGNDVVTIIHPSHDFKSSPATLRFYIDEKQKNKFEFINSPLSKTGCSAKTYGDWAIVGNSLSLYANIGNECMTKNDIIIMPEIKAEGASVTMKFPEKFFMEPEMKDEDAVDYRSTTEIYTFVSAN